MTDVTTYSTTPTSDAPPRPVPLADADWYVVSVKLRRERFAAQELGRRGLEVFLPRLALERRGTRVVRPLFPGYLFARLALPADWWDPLESTCRHASLSIL